MELVSWIACGCVRAVGCGESGLLLRGVILVVCGLS